MTREGWNGKGMFIIKAGGYSVPAKDTRPNSFVNEAFLKGRGLTHLDILPHIDMWTAQNTYLAGWLASQSDMLAGDWKIYKEPDHASFGASMAERPKNPKLHWTQTPEGKKILAKRKRRSKK
jgi:hypothetical protein